jgi:GAF domain-containing protein
VVPLVGGAVAAQLFSLALKADGAAQVWLFIAAVAAFLAAVVVTVATKVLEARRGVSVAAAKRRQLIDFRDQLMPIASTTADMALQPAGDRIAYLKTVAKVAAGALSTLVSAHVDRPRAVVYLLNVDAEPVAMESVGHAGRGERPRPFEAGTARGDSALEFLASRRTAFYPDLSRNRPPGYDGTMAGYRTFIAVPIWTDNGVYGMVTLDAPAAASFDEGDVALAELTAELMSIPFEIGQDIDRPPGA